MHKFSYWKSIPLLPLKEKAPVFLSSPTNHLPAGKECSWIWTTQGKHLLVGLAIYKPSRWFLWFEPFGKLSKHFRLRVGARSKARPSAFLGLSSGGQFSQKPLQGKVSWDDRFEELDSAVILKSCFSICHCPSVSLGCQWSTWWIFVESFPPHLWIYSTKSKEQDLHWKAKCLFLKYRSGLSICPRLPGASPILLPQALRTDIPVFSLCWQSLSRAAFLPG